MNYTKNTDLNFFDTYRIDTNCGSFAFNVEEWYSPLIVPDPYWTMEEWIDAEYDCYENCESFSDAYAAMVREAVLEDFSETIRPVKENEPIESNEELVALRCMIYWEESDGELIYTDWDYHFKVFRDNKWQEKTGTLAVRDCTLDNWDYGINNYKSTVYFFAHKILTS